MFLHGCATPSFQQVGNGIAAFSLGAVFPADTLLACLHIRGIEASEIGMMEMRLAYRVEVSRTQIRFHLDELTWLRKTPHMAAFDSCKGGLERITEIRP